MRMFVFSSRSMAKVFIAIVIISQFVILPFGQTMMKSFSPIPTSSPGSYLCVTDQPSLVLNEDQLETEMIKYQATDAPLQVSCSYICTVSFLCVAFNFIDYPEPLCQLYYFFPYNCSAVLHCTHYTTNADQTCVPVCQVSMLAWGSTDEVKSPIPAYIISNNTQIIFNQVGVSYRGFNTAELNFTTCTLYNFQQFDTYTSSTSFVNYLNNLRTGTILAGTTVDDAQYALSSDAIHALSNIGVDVSGLVFRGKATFVAQKGQPQPISAACQVTPSGGSYLTMVAAVKGVTRTSSWTSITILQ